jgi:hypothetical protein
MVSWFLKVCFFKFHLYRYSARMQAARGGGVFASPLGVPISGAAISAYDAAAGSILERKEGNKAARADAAADAAGVGYDDDEIIEEEGIGAPGGARSEAGRSIGDGVSIVEESMAYTDDFEPLSHANTRVLSDDVMEEGLAAAAAAQLKRAAAAGKRPPGFASRGLSPGRESGGGVGNVHAQQEQGAGAAFDDSFDDKYKTVTAKHDEVGPLYTSNPVHP